MPTWGNTDAVNAKPKFDVERQTREVVQLYVSAGNTAGNNMITVAYNDGAQNNVANVGVSVGQYVYFMANGFAAPGGTSGNGYPGFFASNTTVSAISGNTITLGTNLFGVVNAGWGVEFDKAIVYNANKAVETTYNRDTILVTPTRLNNVYATGTDAQANVGPGIYTANVGNITQGWVHIQKKTNNDGTVRYLKETLVALANPVASNTASGNTSFGTFLTGV